MRKGLLKKFSCVVGALLVALSFGAGVSPLKTTASSIAEISLLDPNFSNTEESLIGLNISQDEISNSTPFNTTLLQKQEGKSFIPSLVGDEGFRHFDKSLNIASKVADFEVANTDLNKLSLHLYFNLEMVKDSVSRGLTISLSDSSSENYISWEIPAEFLKSLVTRTTTSEFDKNIFGSEGNVPVGWVKLELPLDSSYCSVAGNIISGSRFVFSSLKLVQADNLGPDNQMKFYDIKIASRTTTSEISATVQDYAQIYINTSKEIVDSSINYYKGEYFPKFYAPTEFMYSCYIGDVNYLDKDNFEELVIEVDPGLGSQYVKKYLYGTQEFKLEASSYKIKYGLYYNSRFVSLKSATLTVSSYGQGVWFTPIEGNIEKGNSYKLYFTIHDAFKDAEISFTSSDESILKIVEVDRIHNFVKVEALSEGNAGISISIQDARLVNTDYEDTGLVNDDFNISVKKPVKKVNTTKVMLWVAFGLLVAGLIALAVKAIIDAKKVEVR